MQCPECERDGIVDRCPCGWYPPALPDSEFVYTQGEDRSRTKHYRCEYAYPGARCNFPVSHFEGRKLCQWHNHWARVATDHDDIAERTEFESWWTTRNLSKWFGCAKEHVWQRLRQPHKLVALR